MTCFKNICNMLETRKSCTPIDPGLKLKLCRDCLSCKKVDTKDYQSLIGSLVYLGISTKPDIIHTLNLCKGTLTLTGRVAATIGDHIPVWFFYLAGAAVMWKSRKQQSVALSITEAEYMDLPSAAKEVVYLKNLLFELGFHKIVDGPTKLYGDNLSSLQLVKNVVYHARGKHIDIRVHYVREVFQKQLIGLKYIPTEEMPADVLTRSLQKNKHGIGLRECVEVDGNSMPRYYRFVIMFRVLPHRILIWGVQSPLRVEFSSAVNPSATNTSRNESVLNDSPGKVSIEDLDSYSQEFFSNRIKASPFQKVLLSVGSSIASLVDPHRHDMIACLGETTGTSALAQILQTMQASPEGQRILNQKPRINTKTVDLNQLRNLPDNTFGRTYVKFLDDNNVTPDSRMEVRFVDDAQLAYVMTRYRECHDLVHTILGMPTNMLGEVAVKWVEALNTGLPMCYGGAVFGAARLRPKQRKEYVSRYLPWAISNGKSIKPLMAVYWEERWEQPVSELRNELGIILLT